MAVDVGYLEAFLYQFGKSTTNEPLICLTVRAHSPLSSHTTSIIAFLPSVETMPTSWRFPHVALSSPNTQLSSAASMTSTPALPNPTVPLEPTSITQDQGTEAFKDIVYGSVCASAFSPSILPLTACPPSQLTFPSLPAPSAKRSNTPSTPSKSACNPPLYISTPAL